MFGSISTHNYFITACCRFALRICRVQLLGQSFVYSGCGRGLLQDEDHSGNDFKLVPGFLVIFPGFSRNGSGECPYLWAQRNSTNLDRAPKIRNSVLLNLWDSFSVTLPSISSETCVLYSSVNPGTHVVYDSLLLDYSCVSLQTAVNFRLFLNVAISWGKSVQQYWKLIYCFFKQLRRLTKKCVQISEQL